MAMGMAMTDRNKPGVAFWATVMLVVAVLYVLSFGPACWLCDRDVVSEELVESIYRPVIICAGATGPSWTALRWYGELLPTPQLTLNTTPFGHSGWRMPTAMKLALNESFRRYERNRTP
jgi:hypothetical protein